MGQKLISLGEDFTIEDDSGNRVFELEGKVIRTRGLISDLRSGQRVILPRC
jgi:uncharacterized protein YxjI